MTSQPLWVHLFRVHETPQSHTDKHASHDHLLQVHQSISHHMHTGECCRAELCQQHRSSSACLLHILEQGNTPTLLKGQHTNIAERAQRKGRQAVCTHSLWAASAKRSIPELTGFRSEGTFSCSEPSICMGTPARKHRRHRRRQ